MLIKEFLDANPSPIEPGYVFAVLPEKTKAIYLEYVKKAADSLGLRCESFLDFRHPGDALRDILARIQKAEILVYDITDLTPNVMWELGVALAIKDAERVIVIREKSHAPLPFDIYSHRVSFEYDPNREESLNELSKTLREMMQRINRASRSRMSPIESPEVKSLLEIALKAVERKEWIVAEALFQTMDARKPDNWYIYDQWGIMHRDKGEFEAANEKLNQALTLTDSDDDKAFIYTEIAVLNQMSRRYPDAEDWFRKAEKADSENNRLYIAWAEFYDKLEDYFSAQAKIKRAIGRLNHDEGDPNYKELMLRHAYYGKKIKTPTYTESFEQFKREQTTAQPVQARADGCLKPEASRPKEFFDANPNPIKRSGIIPPQPVLLGASAPRAVRPGDSFVVRFAAYIKRLEGDVKTQLAELSPNSQTHLAVREAKWHIGTHVKVQLSSPHLKVLSPEEEFTWLGRKEIIDFNVQSPSDVSEIGTVLNFNVSIGGISVAKFLLDLSVSRRPFEEDRIPVSTSPATTAFASYASKDRLRVLDRLAEVQRSGLDVFVDCLALHPGEQWKPRIQQEITSRDLFLLFWSANAKKSKWVTWEWKTALRERGISRIDPHPLDPTREARPPTELRELHFGDPYMLVRKAFEEFPRRKSRSFW
jgi:tetratricopeptide (TPR) repeat protein